MSIDPQTISVTASGYVKRLPLDAYRQQHPGGRGVNGMSLSGDDCVTHLHLCSGDDYLLFFTNRGKVYWLKAHDLPESSRTGKGSPLSDLLPLSEGEQVKALMPTRDYTEGRYLAFATAQGLIKKTEFSAYKTSIRSDGIAAIKLRDGDELVGVCLTSGTDDILMVSCSGHVARFSEEPVRPMGRSASGIKGMNVSDAGNRVVALEVAADDAELFVVTESGYGKRTRVADYPIKGKKGRGTKGVRTAHLTERKGSLAAALIVRDRQDLLFISRNGIVQRTPVSDICRMGRSTEGVRVMKVMDDDSVSAIATVPEYAQS
jgi:DNA gyrase subunit A